jgi:hypothetical protein
VAFLRGAFALVVAAATIGTLAPGEWRERTAALIVAALVAVPVLRLTWLTVRWARRGDLQFAARALALLVVIGAGALLAL